MGKVGKKEKKPKGIPPEPALAKAGAGMTRKKAKEKPNGIPDKIAFCKSAKSDFSGMTAERDKARVDRNNNRIFGK